VMGAADKANGEHPCARGSSDHLVGAGPCACPDSGQPQGFAPTIHLFDSEILGWLPYGRRSQFKLIGRVELTRPKVSW